MFNSISTANVRIFRKWLESVLFQLLETFSDNTLANFLIGPGVKGVGKIFIKDTLAYFDKNLEGKCFIRNTLAYNTKKARVNEGKHTFIGVFRRVSIIKKNCFMRKTLAYLEEKNQ